MSIDLIKQRLAEFRPVDKEHELQAVKEIVQEVALCALARQDFFKHAAFMGGTCLRILHKLPRFSEDLDFVLLTPDSSFSWSSMLGLLAREFEAYDLRLEVKDRSKADQAVKKAFLKEDSFGRVLQLTYERRKSDSPKIIVKLEVDTNPPANAVHESRIVRFPFPFSVTAHDLPSLFAGKCHALLCREYVKGRDWFDFLWYISRDVKPNFSLLKSALMQQGPWKDQDVSPDSHWLKTELHHKIDTIDWQRAQGEVLPFVYGNYRESLRDWKKDFFHMNVDLLA